MHFAKTYLLVSWLTLTIFTWALRVNGQADLPKIIHPSPTAAALFKYLDYPVDHSTGIPQISVPLYEVKSGSLSVPISISYHAAGRKVNDQDGPVAVGWSLNAGGMISRTIYGSVDFGTSGKPTYNFPNPFKLDDLSNSTDYLYLERIMHYGVFNNPGYPDAHIQPWYDSEYDIFSYSFGGNSGKFFFKDNNGVKTPALLPYKPFKIVPGVTPTGIDKIEITDDKGTYYLFIQGESYDAANDNATSSWLLSKIISANKTDTITFKYTLFTEERVSINQQAVLIDKWQAYNDPYPSDYLTYPENTIREHYTVSRLTEIKFKNGKVVFNLVNDSYEIDNIQILDENNTAIKSIQFNRSICYSQGELGYATTKLNTLVFKGISGMAAETYSFEYYPVISSNNQLNARYCDWWGYYNNSGQHDFVPHYTNLEYIWPGGVTNSYQVGNPSASREPALEALKTGVLKKIIYPTGGSTEFVYENNRCTLYGSTISPRNGPGLRVYQIKTTDNYGTVSTKTYKYGVNECGYGAIELLPQLSNMASEVTYNYIQPQVWGTTCLDPEGGPISYRLRTFYSGFISGLNDLANRPVIYTEVTEYNGDEINNIGKTVYNYDPNYSMWSAQPMQNFGQATIYKMHIYEYNYWNTPTLTLRTDYKRINNGPVVSYVKVKETSYGYQNTVTEYVRGLHVQRMHVYPQAGLECRTGYYAEKFAVINYGTEIYSFAPYRIPVGYKALTGTSETTYNDDGSVVTTGISNEYNAYQLVKKTTQTSSDGSSLLTEIKYPFDYTGDATLSQMVSLNMLNFPVEQHEFRNTTPVKSVRTSYHNWSSNTPMIAPFTIEVKKGSHVYETRLRYLAYDANGNPVSVSKEKDAPVAYVWDYRNTLPVAEVKNATPADIAFTSFEADGAGNWTGLITSNYAIGTALTGSVFYNLNGSSLSKSGLSSSKTYTISYWSKNGAYGVSGTPIAGWPKSIRSATVNGITWTCWEHKVTGVTTITLSGTGAIDELRLYPANALMTSYCFKPLIGMSAQNDINNNIQYFEYDAYGRLKLIRDMDNNIIKTFNYQYQSATP